jgi:hypothetical protein
MKRGFVFPESPESPCIEKKTKKQKEKEKQECRFTRRFIMQVPADRQLLSHSRHLHRWTLAALIVHFVAPT